MRWYLFALLCATVAQAQTVTFGVKGGVPFGSPTEDYGALKVRSDHWTVGPTAEFRLPAHLSLEIDALYSAYTVRYPVIAAPASTPSNAVHSSSGDVRAWDFPLALKYRFTDGPARPFVLGGANYRRENQDIRPDCVSIAAQVCSGASYSTSQDRLGPVAGAGIEFRYQRFRISPEFRYTRLNRPGSNQYGVLLGITF